MLMIIATLYVICQVSQHAIRLTAISVVLLPIPNLASSNAATVEVELGDVLAYVHSELPSKRLNAEND